MTAAHPPIRDERVLVLLPTARDGARMREMLVNAGLGCALCGDLAELCREMRAGAGVALLTEDALAADRSGCLAEELRMQPAWSDFPLIILARKGTAGRSAVSRESVNVSLVERPVRIRSLLSVIRAALRSRRHQYEVRNHLAERAVQEEALRDQEENLQFALAAGKLGAWTLDLATEALECSALFKENFGRPADAPFSYQDLFEAIHPEERARVRSAVRRAIEERTGYDTEYRILWPDGTTHWVLVRGRATYAPDGTPLHMRGVSLDMTQRRRDEEALRAADRKKDDFLALLAHELRNPLAPIRNGLQVLRLTRDPEVRERSQQIMERQLGHMVRLIDDLLDVSRINRNKLTLQLGRITLADVVGSAVETARPAIDAAGHTLFVELPSEPVLLDADLTRLAQVFANLLTNSAKYTERGGRIVLTARREGDEAVVSVADTGIGIPGDFLHSIFDMFSQVDRSIERTTGGLGIGLALVKGLVEMHGGTVTAASGGPGRGSEFTVRLPAVPLRTQAAPGPQAAGRGPEAGPKRRVLVVDDNQDSAESMAEMLRLFGNEVAVAHDGLEAVARAAEFRPQFILMDVGMPRMGGLEATRRIREQPGGDLPFIIALTGWGQDSDRRLSKQAGCDAHLTKPVNIDELRQLLVEPRAGHPRV